MGRAVRTGATASGLRSCRGPVRAEPVPRGGSGLCGEQGLVSGSADSDALCEPSRTKKKQQQQQQSKTKEKRFTRGRAGRVERGANGRTSMGWPAENNNNDNNNSNNNNKTSRTKEESTRKRTDCLPGEKSDARQRGRRRESSTQHTKITRQSEKQNLDTTRNLIEHDLFGFFLGFFFKGPGLQTVD